MASEKGEKWKGRVEKACGRLLSHASIETAPRDAVHLSVEPRLLERLVSQYDGGVYGMGRYALSDRALLGAVARGGTLDYSSLGKALLNGVSTASLAATRGLLASIGSTPAPLESFSPGAGLVDDAVAAAARATAAYNELRERMRAVRAVEEAEQRERGMEDASCRLPAEWENLGPRAGTDEDSVPTECVEVTPRRGSTGRTLRASTRKAMARCCFCPEHSTAGEEGELLGPFVNARGVPSLYVHFECACWAPQVYADTKTGKLRGVYDEYRRGRQLKCSACRGKGATVGCYVEKCKRVFHYRCLEGHGARKVGTYFAAFCRAHGHLADKPLYRELMAAHTIADVAAVSGMRETTDGLDAPHSRYTGLRRRDTEVIFSRRGRTCSHAACHEHATVLYSMAKRRVLHPTESFRHADRVRRVRHTAIAVASGYFSQVSTPSPSSSHSHAHAHAPRRKRSALLLLRNLRGAPRWTADDIAVDKDARKRSLHFNVRVRDEGGTRSGDGERLPPRKRARTGSAPLPAAAKHRDRGASAVQAGTGAEAAAPPVSQRSGWRAFLDEQLPRERALRPDDDGDQALANMARLWSLLTREERSRYEARARASSPPRDSGGAGAGVPSAWQAGSGGGAGLFSVRTAGTSPSRPKSTGTKPKRSAGAAEERGTFTLGTRRGRLRGRGEADVDWDAMFPLELPTTTGMGGGKGGTSSVRPPPR